VKLNIAFIQTAMIKLMTMRLARYPLSWTDSYAYSRGWAVSC